MVRLAISCGLLVLSLCACGASSATELGSLSLSLTTEASGQRYRLASARFALDGPEPQTLSADGDAETLTVEIMEGSYTLQLLDGWALERMDGKAAQPVQAKLLSANPAPVLISAGETTQAVLRFELASGALLPMGERGILEVRLSVEGSADGGQPPACTGALRISEFDYEQVGDDKQEFVEVANGGACDAPLEGVTIELINGEGGRSYAAYALSDAAQVLPAGSRLLVASPALLETLASSTLGLALRGSGLQNGPDAVRLLRDTEVLDAVAYEGPVASVDEGSPAAADLGESSLSRCPEDVDSNDNALDFALTTPTPGAPNVCG